jgi:hypothetical protein
MAFKYLTILLLLILFYVDAREAKAQCTNGLALVKKEVSGKGEGHLKIKVDAKSHFTGRLIEIESNDGINLVKENFSGTGAGIFSFKHLNSNKAYNYKIEVDFLDEDKFLCKKKVLIDIQFSDN